MSDYEFIDKDKMIANMIIEIVDLKSGIKVYEQKIDRFYEANKLLRKQLEKAIEQRDRYFNADPAYNERRDYLRSCDNQEIEALDDIK